MTDAGRGQPGGVARDGMAGEAVARDGSVVGAPVAIASLRSEIDASLGVESERVQLDEVFRFAPSFMAVLRGPHHVFERVNEQYSKLIGGRRVVGMAIREAMPELAGQGFYELLDRVYQGGETVRIPDGRVQLAGMGEIVLDFVYQPLRDRNGTITGVLAHGVDLTAGRAAEQRAARLAEENDRQRRMFETALSNTADFVYLFDTNGRFTFVNKPLLDLWGKSLDQAVGRTFFDLDYPPPLAAKLHAQIAKVVATGSRVRDETEYTSAMGTRRYEYIFMPVFAADGTVEAVAGSTRDITDRARADDALRHSETRYRMLVTAAADVVFRMSADWSEMDPLDGRTLVASNAGPMRDWMEKNLPESEHARVRAEIRRAIEEKNPFELVHQVIGADGALGWTHSRAVPILDDAGQIVEWFGTAQDATERKRATDELHDIRSRMEAALEAGAIGTWSWDIQTDRFIGDASFARIFNLPPHAVSGGPIDGIVDAIHPDDRAHVLERVNQAIADCSRYQTEYRVRRADASWRWVAARGKVECDHHGRAARFPGVVIDISDQKRAQEDLTRITEESERRRRLYETILSNTPDLAYVWDLDHRFIYANDVLLQMWGKTWDEAIGKRCIDLGYEAWHAEMHDREIELVRSTGKPYRGEVPFHGTFGPRIYEYILVPVFGEDGTVEAVAGTTRDTTDRKLVEEALRDADRKKDDFIALLAHELRNPLAPIRNGLHMIRVAGDNTHAIAKAREMMDRQLSHMVRLIDDLLDVSRVTRNKMELRRARVTLAEVIANAVEAAGPAIHEKRHELIVRLPDEPIILDADLTRLAQVFSNLLANSAKYTPERGTIEIIARHADGSAIVSVRDNGIGIPANSLATIFDMFSQVDRTMERSSGGLGIGLALVKGLVEMHAGTVRVESTEGHGSTFTVCLPVATPQVHGNAAASPAGHAPTTMRRVLVVDDNADSAESMSELMRLMGNEVETAGDGEEAVAIAERFRPQIILMDIGLPKLNGLEATRRIREQAWGQGIHIVALTGWGQDEDRAKSREAGCDGHLVKPVELPDLERVLAAVRSGDLAT